MRPTLEEQIAVSKMTDEELVELLRPPRVKFWLYRHCNLLWSIVYWNWFDIWEGIEDADEYRSWYMKLKRRLFGGNKDG